MELRVRKYQVVGTRMMGIRDDFVSQLCEIPGTEEKATDTSDLKSFRMSKKRLYTSM